MELVTEVEMSFVGCNNNLCFGVLLYKLSLVMAREMILQNLSRHFIDF
jgi:hypothetical protein